MDQQMIDSAEKSDVVQQLRGFTMWVGAGCKLTPTGRLTMADARALVDLLATGDEIDPQIGSRVFTTRTSQDLAGLTLVLEWALAAHLVRRVHGRLVAVKKAVPLLDRPLELWERAFEVFPDLGAAVCRSGWFQSLLVSEFRVAVSAMLVELYAAARTAAELNTVSWETVTVPYRIDEATTDRPVDWRGRNDVENGHTLQALELLGAIRGVGAGSIELTPLGRWAVRRELGEAGPGEPVYRITVSLLDVTDPPVWRRLEVSAGIRLDRLHAILQAAMGWEDYHLHSFTVDGARYGVPDPDLDFRDEHATRLSELARRPGVRIVYKYDFGDGWDHEIVVEESLTAGETPRPPVCLAGEGACPPEDCGGTGGYRRLREVLANPDDAEHHDVVDWLGLDRAADFDPHECDVARTNEALGRIR